MDDASRGAVKSGAPSLTVRRVIAACLTVLALPWIAAGQQSDDLLPAETIGYAVAPSVATLREQWDQTTLGGLFKDPAMEPFGKELQARLDDEISQLDRRLGLKWKDLEEVQGGELAISYCNLGDSGLAVGLLVDVRGKQDAAEDLLARIREELTRQQVTARPLAVGGVEATEYTFRPRPGRLRIHKAYYALHRDWLIASDQASLLEFVIKRLDGAAAPTLRSEPDYSAVVEKCAEAAQRPAHLRWYARPFQFVKAVRDSSSSKRNTRYAEAFERQGFDAIKAVGGQVAFHQDEREMIHHSFIYAPPAASGGRFRLAARMLDFPNHDGVEPPEWIPADAASVLSLNWQMKNAFNYAGSLVNELAKDDVFEDVLASIRDDENGPQIDLRKEVVDHLTEEAWLVTRIDRPITPTSEWKLLAFGVNAPEQVASAVERSLKNDPYARRRQGHPDIWEIFEKSEQESGDAGGFGFGSDPQKDRKDERLIKNGAITVQHGYLMFATDAKFLEQVKAHVGVGEERRLGKQRAFGRVWNAVRQIGDGRHAGRFFVRHHAIQAANYELLRAGKMPQSATTLGQLLNWMLAPEEKELQREQEIDGSTLPPYEKVESYLGVGGLAIRTENDGWLIWGCMLPPDAKETPASAAAAPSR